MMLYESLLFELTSYKLFIPALRLRISSFALSAVHLMGSKTRASCDPKTS